jgi:hypothetical protein
MPDDGSRMKRTHYLLRPRSGGWTDEHRLVRFDMTVEHQGKRLGGHNVQVVLGAADAARRGLDEDIALTLDSGWWITFRNQFALAPCVAVEILESVRNPLTEVTAAATDARNDAARDVSRKLFCTVFEASGPAYWL